MSGDPGRNGKDNRKKQDDNKNTKKSTNVSSPSTPSKSTPPNQSQSPSANVGDPTVKKSAVSEEMAHSQPTYGIDSSSDSGTSPKKFNIIAAEVHSPPAQTHASGAAFEVKSTDKPTKTGIHDADVIEKKTSTTARSSIDSGDSIESPEYDSLLQHRSKTSATNQSDQYSPQNWPQSKPRSQRQSNNNCLKEFYFNYEAYIHFPIWMVIFYLILTRMDYFNDRRKRDDFPNFQFNLKRAECITTKANNTFSNTCFNHNLASILLTQTYAHNYCKLGLKNIAENITCNQENKPNGTNFRHPMQKTKMVNYNEPPVIKGRTFYDELKKIAGHFVNNITGITYDDLYEVCVRIFKTNPFGDVEVIKVNASQKSPNVTYNFRYRNIILFMKKCQLLPSSSRSFSDETPTFFNDSERLISIIMLMSAASLVAICVRMVCAKFCRKVEWQCCKGEESNDSADKGKHKRYQYMTLSSRTATLSNPNFTEYSELQTESGTKDEPSETKDEPTQPSETKDERSEPKDESNEPKDESNEPKDESNEPKDESNEPKYEFSKLRHKMRETNINIT